MTWRWHGRALPLEGDGAALVLTASRDHDELRSRAARVVRKLFQRPEPGPAALAADAADPLFSDAFVLSDGTRFFTAVPIRTGAASAPLVLFPDGVPAPERDLTVIACAERRRAGPGAELPSVICFTPGTRLRTETGPVAIEDLSPGDRVLTRDDGPQPVVWSGHCRMSGARLYAMPDQRPVRLRRGALGMDRPDADLVVSPDHRVLLTSRAADELWGEREVLVRAGDLVGDHRVSIDHSLRETWYIHLMLDRHQVVWANGLEVESFHPGHMMLDSLSALQRTCLFAQRPDLAEDPAAYGASARRMLSRAEAAILLDGAPTRRAAAPVPQIAAP